MKFAEEQAVVSQIEGDYVLLETDDKGSCDNCSTQSGCGQIASIFTFKPRNKLKVSNTLKLKKGDQVIIGMPSEKMLKATVLMYLLPLIFLFMFSLVAKLLMGESASIIGGLSGLFLGLIFVKHYSRTKKVADQFQPKLIRKIITIEAV